MHVRARTFASQKKRDKGQPFAYKTIKRRKRGNRHGSDQEKSGGPGHFPDQSSETLHVPRVRSGKNRTRTKEQKTFEHRVVDHMIKGRDKGKARVKRLVKRFEDERHPDAQKDDPDIFDTGKSEQSFQIVFHQRVKNAEERGKNSDRKDHMSKGANHEIS